MLILLLTLAAATAAAPRQDAGTRAAETFKRAMQLEAKGDAAGALALLWEAAGLAPGDADIQNGLGERSSVSARSMPRWTRTGSPWPRVRGSRDASNNLILALVKAGRGREAVERARAEVAAAPGDPDQHFTLGLAQSEPDVDGAIASFRRVLQIAPRHALARYNLALVLRRADRMSEAIDELQRVLDVAPRAEAHYTLGVIHLHRGDVDRAAAALRAAIAAQPCVGAWV